VPAVAWRDLSGPVAPEEPSAIIRARVEQAREIQRERFKGRPAVRANAHMSARDIRHHCRLHSEADALLQAAMSRLALSARAYHRVLKIARTIADLAEAQDLEASHVAEAIQYRALDRR
jgi:magnesium chelatase family protein